MRTLGRPIQIAHLSGVSSFFFVSDSQSFSQAEAKVLYSEQSRFKEKRDDGHGTGDACAAAARVASLTGDIASVRIFLTCS